MRERSELNKGPDGSEKTSVRGAGTDDPHAERGERTGRRALTPAQGLERGRDGGEVKGHDGHTSMTYSRVGMRHQCRSFVQMYTERG